MGAQLGCACVWMCGWACKFVRVIKNQHAAPEIELLLWQQACVGEIDEGVKVITYTTPPLSLCTRIPFPLLLSTCHTFAINFLLMQHDEHISDCTWFGSRRR